MIQLQFPPYQPKIKQEGGVEYIFDTIRKRWIKLTPEEWVRQNIIQYLVVVKGFSASLIAVEKEIMLSDVRKRFDIVVYDQQTKPWMVIECKAMDIALTATVLQQALTYNIALKLPYIVITNGLHCAAFTSIEGQLSEVDIFPG
ncbi:MAG: type I restriction enzyme HsdR N-terminal domain-containing protein [Ferruginibacter sp.]